MWQKKDNSLYQKFEFKDFDEAFGFVEKVARIARERNHHPKITNVYNVVELWLSSHDAGNKVTSKDTGFAKQVDKLLNQKSIADEPAAKPNTEPAGAAAKAAKTSSAEPESQGLDKAKLFTDGGSRGNPGPSATGYVLLDMEDNVVKKEGAYIGVTTNNQAEYQALKAGLEEALVMGVTELDVYMDSMLVVSQVNGTWKIKNQELLPLHQAIRQLIPHFKKVTFSYVPRAMNHLADAMVNECLDAQ